MLIRKFKQKKERCGIKKERESVGGGAKNENDRMNGGDGDQETEKNTRVSPQ